MWVATASRVRWSRTSRVQSITETVSLRTAAVFSQAVVAAPSRMPGPRVSRAWRGWARGVPSAEADSRASRTREAASEAGSVGVAGAEPAAGEPADALGAGAAVEAGSPGWPPSAQPARARARAATPATRGRRRRAGVGWDMRSAPSTASTAGWRG